MCYLWVCACVFVCVCSPIRGWVSACNCPCVFERCGDVMCFLPSRGCYCPKNVCVCVREFPVACCFLLLLTTLQEEECRLRWIPVGFQFSGFIIPRATPQQTCTKTHFSWFLNTSRNICHKLNQLNVDHVTNSFFLFSWKLQL